MNAVMEYTGELMGGPNDGTPVTSSVARIPVTIHTEIWLDGMGTEKKANTQIVSGSYIWNPVAGYFKWNLESASISTRSTTE